MDVNGPEPCITSFKTGRCYSPLACSGFGYCRDRNLKYGYGAPTDAQVVEWRKEAAALKAAGQR
jgi:hypothetical protein